MTTYNRAYFPAHPVVIFWLGVLTGVIIVGIIFLYKALQASDYTSALLKMPTIRTSIQTKPSKTAIGDPGGYMPTGGAGQISIGDPGGY